LQRLRFFLRRAEVLAPYSDDSLLGRSAENRVRRSLIVAIDRFFSRIVGSGFFWCRGMLRVDFVPGFCDSSTKYLFAVLVGHADKQSAALFALDACEFRRDLTRMGARVVDRATRLGFLIIQFGMVAQVEVKAVHCSIPAV
jgi:hypothetical protein